MIFKYFFVLAITEVYYLEKFQLSRQTAVPKQFGFVALWEQQPKNWQTSSRVCDTADTIQKNLNDLTVANKI